ncbi:BQ2448_5308 [Microbotryum intermedium]|uniref:BQ2448_5308 protein n=1 Tax=Microbotryum intermedium TaxID=269621 RepID=A0A238F3T0_9BASI|nr:BQ2448_5308 [Microbotryum intermedium]
MTPTSSSSTGAVPTSTSGSSGATPSGAAEVEGVTMSADQDLDKSNPSVASYEAAHGGFREAIQRHAEAIDAASTETTGYNLKGKTVVITGAGSGFGRAFAEKAAGYGAFVVISDLNVKAVQETGRRIQTNCGLVKVYPKPCNTASWDSQIEMFDFAVKHHGVIDVVVANAGVGECGELMHDEFDSKGKLKVSDSLEARCTERRTDLSRWESPRQKPVLTTIEVNLLGAMYTARIGFYHMARNLKNQSKALVFLGSMASQNGLPKGPMYGMAKHGILGLFRSIYYDCEAANIRSNIICPWFIDTGIIAPLNRAGLFGIPLGKIEDVVAGMLKSASDPSFHGYQVAIDANGILAIPFEATSIGPEGYYAEFGNRAIASIKLERKLKDVGLILAATIKYWSPKGWWAKVLTLAAMAALVRRRLVLGRAP